MKKEIIILLTGTINVSNKHYTSLSNPTERKKQYMETILYYLSNFEFPVVYIENSGIDISNEMVEQINSKRLEIISFTGNNYSAELGKGLGEMKCIEYAINHSKFISDNSFIFKITGRYKILNLKNIISQYLENTEVDILVDFTKYLKYSASAIFGFTRPFANNYLFRFNHLLNDSKNYFFEHALAQAALIAIGEGSQYALIKHYPKISAISGTTGKKYPSSFLYYFPRYLKYKIRDFILKR
jgi:hypothetical protein